MEIITLKEYRELKNKGCKLIGRVHKSAPEFEPICFRIDEEQMNYSSAKILDIISLSSKEITRGDYLILRHWCFPEISQISY